MGEMIMDVCQCSSGVQSFVNVGGAGGIAGCLGIYGAVNQGGGSSMSGGGIHGPSTEEDASPVRPVAWALWSVITACTYEISNE